MEERERQYMDCFIYLDEGEDDLPVTTTLRLTDEGLVVDVCHPDTGEVLRSTWMLAQELTDLAK